MMRFLGFGAAASAAAMPHNQAILKGKQGELIILAAPGGQFYNHRLANDMADGFRAQQLHVQQIGDGEKPITEKEWRDFCEAVKVGDQPLIVILAKGKPFDYSEGPGIYLDDSGVMPMRKLIAEVSEMRQGKKFDVISTAGNEKKYASSAQNDIPKGSTYISLSPFHDWYGGVEELVTHLKSVNYFHGDISASKLLIAYLALSKEIYRGGMDKQFVELGQNFFEEVPHTSVPMHSLGNNLCDLSHMANYSLGTVMSGTSYIANQLQRFVDRKEIDDLMARLPHTNHDNFVLKSRQQYGLLYAISYTYFVMDKPEFRSEWRNDERPEPVRGVGAKI